LIVTKPDPKLSKLTKDLSVWLLDTFPGITLFVDKKLQGRSSFKYQEILDQNPSWSDRLQFWTKDCQACKEKQIHLAVTLGGDGTVLYTTWMFQKRVPPIVAVREKKPRDLEVLTFDYVTEIDQETEQEKCRL